MEVMMTNGVVRHAKLQSTCDPNKPTPNFYRPDALPVTQPTVSKHWSEMTDKWLLIVIPSIFIDELEVFQSEG